jgi:hypothetical protein
MEPVNLPPKPLLKIFAEISDMQVKLIESILTSVRDVGLIEPRLRLGKIKSIEDNLISFQDDVIHLERIFESPREYLQSYRDIEKQVQDKSEVVNIEYGVLNLLRAGQLADRRIRIFTLLEHLQRQISYKKSELQFNRTILFSFLTLLVALIALGISVALRSLTPGT